jgi:hypothetical protein
MSANLLERLPAQNDYAAHLTDQSTTFAGKPRSNGRDHWFTPSPFSS